MYEIEAGKLAQSKGAKTKNFGEALVKDHSATSSDLKNLVASGKVKADVPAALDSSHKIKLDKLQGCKAVASISDF
jgi:putative membrane protein